MEFENFTKHIQDLIFEETSKYLSDCVGTNKWDKDLHATHGLIMYNVVKAMSKKMNIYE